MSKFTIKLDKGDSTAVITTEIESQIIEVSGSYEEGVFTPAWFSDCKAEEFYNSNWEAIDRKINLLT